MGMNDMPGLGETNEQPLLILEYYSGGRRRVWDVEADPEGEGPPWLEIFVENTGWVMDDGTVTSDTDPTGLFLSPLHLRDTRTGGC